MSQEIAIAFNSTTTLAANQLETFLKENNYVAHLISESQPDLLRDRSKVVQSCSACIVIASRDFQKNVACMELLNYAKDLKKAIIVVNPDYSYQPFGALGSIAAISETGLLQLGDEQSYKASTVKILSLLGSIRPKSSKPVAAEERPRSSRATSASVARPMSSKLLLQQLEHTGKVTDVLVSFHPEAAGILGMIEVELKEKKFDFVLEAVHEEKTSINTAKVIVVIMSAGYEANENARLIVETARATHKPIIPVSTSRKFKPNQWLGLVIAGKLYYRFDSKEKAYEKKYDTTAMNNFLYGIKLALSPKPTTSLREEAEIKVISKRLEECKSKIGEWPPRKRETREKVRKAVKVVLQEPKSDIEFTHIHYTVTRLDFIIPTPLYDEYGVPLRDKFDCMISYQWDFQDLVREVYMDLHMRNLKMWFDIWGGMEGNSNDSMATAIESSKVVLVFLSDSYQKSTNCIMELKYSIACGKPIIFIIVQNDFTIEPWIQSLIEENYKFEIYSLADLSIMHNKVPRIDCLSQAIRAIGVAQPDYNDYDLSDEVFNMKQTLNDALDEIAANTGKARFKKCTRCNKDYEEDNPVGCKAHSAYYVGGSIIAGRWVCCNQQDKNGVGCRDEKHTEAKRVWTVNPSYGTYTWEPK